MRCRHCSSELSHLFVDLGFQPPSNAYLDHKGLSGPEVTYPLRVRICDNCWLAQTEDYAAAEEFFSPDYAYLSSASSSWVTHAAAYVEMISERLSLGPDSFVIEVAANDGYLLQNFIKAGVPCLGIEPTDIAADIAEGKGIPVLRKFFGEALGKELAADGKQVDLICGNNVYAHVPDINDFTKGFTAVLKPEGVVTLEFPHLMRLVEENQFDTIYHEHFSYLSLIAVESIFEAAGLRIFDVDELPTHGKSLRIYGCRKDASHAKTDAVDALREEELSRGMATLDYYLGFQKRTDEIKNRLWEFLLEAHRAGKTVLAYGAAAKGNTLLNYAGVRADMIPYVFDAATSKQNMYLPGSHIPIRPPEELEKMHADYILILPWNLVDEISSQLRPTVGPDTKFARAIPELSVF